jgi:Phosphoinositide phospholipase C, Ca2+-dependent
LLDLVVACWTVCKLSIGGEPRLNQLQAICSHNSYHVAPRGTIRHLIIARNAQRAQGLDYTQRPLSEQFMALGIRPVELDVYADPKG